MCDVDARDMGRQGMKRILIADDDPAIRALMIRVLENKGYTVEAATDGRTALEMITTSPPDLLITDLIMPALTGWSVLSRARQLAPMLPIIIVSGVQPRVRPEEALFPDTTVFLPKPFAIEQLLATVARLLNGLRSDHAPILV